MIKNEHSREDELLVQMIGLEGKIDKLKKEKQELISESLEDLNKMLLEEEEVFTILTDLIEKWEGILND